MYSTLRNTVQSSTRFNNNNQFVLIYLLNSYIDVNDNYKKMRFSLKIFFIFL